MFDTRIRFVDGSRKSRHQRFIDIGLYRFDVIRILMHGNTAEMKQSVIIIIIYLIIPPGSLCNYNLFISFLLCHANTYAHVQIHTPEIPEANLCRNLCHNHKITNQLHVYVSVIRIARIAADKVHLRIEVTDERLSLLELLCHICAEI